MQLPQLTLAELGYKVFPCVPGGKRPLAPHGVLDASSDAETIEAWSRRWPNANWGMATAGLLVVDVDPLADGDANPWLADNYDRAADLAAAPMSITPRGGRHYIFRQPPGLELGNSASKIAPHIDTRANGGYIVVPPSKLESGKVYRWVAGELESGPDQLPLPPTWLLEALGESAPRAAGSRAVAALPANKIPSGQRNVALASMAARMRGAGHSADEMYALLSRVNSDRCNPPLDEREVRSVAESYAKYDPGTDTGKVEHWADQVYSAEVEEDESQYFEPQPLPVDCLRIPGFVAEVMDAVLESAPIPNQALAFCGAICLQ
ncbi:MAG: bifunctional DNA primase/polymerase, partial [Acidobacteriales bacterium]|nr:bifunctional DNA primase/polymerase [Terriglobales bacterium]